MEKFEEWRKNLSSETLVLYDSFSVVSKDWVKALDKCRKEAYEAGARSRQEEINELKNKLREIIIND